MLLPAPFGPTMATRESMSNPKSRPSYSVSYPSYPNAAFMTEMHGGGRGVAEGKFSLRYGSSKSTSTFSSWSFAEHLHPTLRLLHHLLVPLAELLDEVL